MQPIIIPISNCPISGLTRTATIVAVNKIPVASIFDTFTGKPTFDKLRSLVQLLETQGGIKIPDKTCIVDYQVDYYKDNAIVNLKGIHSYPVTLTADNNTPIDKTTGKIVTDVMIPYGNTEFNSSWFSPTVLTENIMGEYDFFLLAMQAGGNAATLLGGGTINADQQLRRFDI